MKSLNMKTKSVPPERKELCFALIPSKPSKPAKSEVAKPGTLER